MSTGTSTDKSSTWRAYVNALRDKLSPQTTDPDTGSWHTQFGRNTRIDSYGMPKMSPPVSPSPFTGNMWAESYTYRMYDPSLLEMIYAPDRGVMQWARWQAALREHEEQKLQAQKDLVEKARSRWDMRGRGGIGWGSPYGQTNWELSQSSLHRAGRN